MKLTERPIPALPPLRSRLEVSNNSRSCTHQLQVRPEAITGAHKRREGSGLVGYLLELVHLLLIGLGLGRSFLFGQPFLFQVLLGLGVPDRISKHVQQDPPSPPPPLHLLCSCPTLALLLPSFVQQELERHDRRRSDPRETREPF